MENTEFLEGFRKQCKALSEASNSACGLSYELYQRRLSGDIDNLLNAVPEKYKSDAVNLARDEFDYLTASEIQEEIRQDRENGFCSHGFDYDCCPLGCGDIDWP